MPRPYKGERQDIMKYTFSYQPNCIVAITVEVCSDSTVQGKGVFSDDPDGELILVSAEDINLGDDVVY